MKLTNDRKIPLEIFRAIEAQKYSGDGEKRDYSVTELLKPAWQRYLEKQHAHEITEEAETRIWSLFGHAVHGVIEEANRDASEVISEERLKATVGGRVIAGGIDLYTKHPDTGKHKVSDFKITSAWTLVYGSRNDEWTAQLNIYAYLFRANGFPVDKLTIIALLRDWTPTQARRDASYPPSQLKEIDFPNLVRSAV